MSFVRAFLDSVALGNALPCRCGALPTMEHAEKNKTITIRCTACGASTKPVEAERSHAISAWNAEVRR